MENRSFRFFWFSIIFFLAGCGNSNDFDSSTTQTTGTGDTVTFKASVSSEVGAPAVGVRWVAHERSTDAKFEGLTDSTGALSTILPPGVYDIGLDLEGDQATATCFFGPITVLSATNASFVLKDSTGRQPGELFGRVFLQSDIPAANRRIVIRPGYTAGNSLGAPLTPIELTSSVDGSFSTLLDAGLEQGLDIEIYDAGGQLDEWVDIAKRSQKACYVEFSTEVSDVENQLRANEANPDTILAQELQVRKQEETALKTFKVKEIDDGTDSGVAGIELTDGVLPVGETYAGADLVGKDETSSIFGKEILGRFDTTTFLIDTNGKWWYTYAVNLIVTTATGSYGFEDETDDPYRLQVNKSGSHKVSYNSDSPNMKFISLIDD